MARLRGMGGLCKVDKGKLPIWDFLRTDPRHPRTLIIECAADLRRSHFSGLTGLRDFKSQGNHAEDALVVLRKLVGDRPADRSSYPNCGFPEQRPSMLPPLSSTVTSLD